jgi:hypothetical protein
MRKEASHHNGIDLALASSYAPACLCIVKVVLLLATHSIMTFLGVESINVFFMLLCVMYIDKCLYDVYIIDSNACALCVLAAVACNVFRLENDSLLDEVPHASVIGLLWSVFALIITTGVPLGAKRLQQDVVQLVPTTMFFILHTFTHIEHFNDLDAWCRGVGFLLLCVVWVYTLNIEELRKARGKSLLPCVIRFTPVLFIHLPVACLFFFSTVVAITWKLQKILCKSTDVLLGDQHAVSNVPQPRNADSRQERTEPHIYKLDGHDIDVNAVFAMTQASTA